MDSLHMEWELTCEVWYCKTLSIKISGYFAHFINEYTYASFGRFLFASKNLHEMQIRYLIWGAWSLLRLVTSIYLSTWNPTKPAYTWFFRIGPCIERLLNGYAARNTRNSLNWQMATSMAIRALALKTFPDICHSSQIYWYVISLQTLRF